MFLEKVVLERGQKRKQNDNCLGVFEFDAFLSYVFGFCKRGGWGGGAKPPQR